MKSSNILNIRESKIYSNNVIEDIKILSAGDFHITKKTKEEDIEFYLENACEENPDYICLLGDLIDNPNDIEQVQELLFKLVKDSSSIAPTFVILGNHDYIYDNEEITNRDIWNRISNMDNIELLDNKVFNNDEVVIMGYNQKKEAYYNNSKDSIDGSDSFYNDLLKHKELYNFKLNLPKIALIHSPEYIIENRNQKLLKNYDLIICGHYHNGCVPPILDRMWNSDKGFINARRYLFPDNVRGIIKLKNNYLIYNGGWTKLSESSTKKLSRLDHLFNRQMDITTLTNNPDFSGIEINQKYKKKTKKIY